MIIGLIEIEARVLISNLTGILWKKLNSRPRPVVPFKIRNTDLQFRSPRYDWQKNKNNTNNYKAFCVLRKCNKRQLFISGNKYEQIIIVGGETIWKSNIVHLLGMTIDYDLDFEKHLS